MNQAPLRLPTEDLHRQREEIRRGLFRVNTALLLIVTVVIGLAVAGIIAAFRASERTLEATAAIQSAKEQLWQSYLAQATAGRLSTTQGRKQKGRQVIEAAARIHPSLELRNESIAQMALLDVASDHQEELPDPAGVWACSPDVTFFATAHTNGIIEVQRLADKQQVLRWQAPSPDVSMLMFSPAATYLLVGFRAGGFEVIDVHNGSVSPKGPQFSAVDFTRDESIVGFLSDPHTVRFVESASGHVANEPLLLDQSARDMDFDRGGERLAVNLGRSVEVWDWRKRQKLATLPHEQPIFSMAWSAQQLAVGDEAGGMRVWDMTSLKPVTWAAHKVLVDYLVFNNRGDLLVSDSWDGSCKVWDPRTGHLLLSSTRGFAKAFSRDDTRLAYAVFTSARNRWGWWQLAMPQGLSTLDCVGASEPNIFQIDFSPDGRRFIVLERDELRVLDWGSGQVLLSKLIKNARSAYFVENGQSLLICADNKISISPLGPEEGNVARLRLGAPRPIAATTVPHLDGVTLSQDRSQIAFTASASDAALLDLSAPDKRVTFAGADKPEMPAVSPDRKWLVTGTFHGRGATVWDAVTGRKVRELDSGNVNPFFSPDGALLVLAGDREYRVYDSGSWKLRYHISTGSAIDLSNYAAFSPDGRQLAIVKERQIVELIDPQHGTLLASLTPPEPQIITWLMFSPDGRSLAAATTVGLIQRWDLASIHRDLAALDLDWDASVPPLQSPEGLPSGKAPAPLSVGSARFIGPAMGSVALVVFCAWFVLRRQRQLFSAYVRIDELMEQRNRELKVAQTELMHSQKMKALGTLAAGIAHDFNNLLSVIRMSNKLIGRDISGNPDLEQNVEEVEKAVQQGKQIVSSMLGFSNERPSNGNGSFFLPDLVEDTVGLLSRQFLSGITLDLQLDRDSPPVSLPRARLEQILLNLIVNAAEAMEGKGHLRVQVRSGSVGGCEVKAPRPAQRYVELIVADTGCGIPDQIRSRIFDPFFTTKAARTNPGTGLGLSMIYTLAERDGLGIGIESAPGKGATFRIVIPVEVPSPVAISNEPNSPVRH